MRPEDLFRYWFANRRDFKFNGDRLYLSAFPNEVLRTDKKELLIHLNNSYEVPSPPRHIYKQARRYKFEDKLSVYRSIN